jgi:hypothetical protein
LIALGFLETLTSGSEVSDTTVRARRDEWIAAGVFEAIAEEAIGGYDRVIGLDLGDVSVDGSLHKSPCGGEGTGSNPTATTRSCSPRHWTMPPGGVCSPRSTRCGWTAATATHTTVDYVNL